MRYCNMKLKQLHRQIKLPCAKCPYKLGQVHTVVNPCPHCRGNRYQMYERFQNGIYEVNTTKDR